MAMVAEAAAAAATEAVEVVIACRDLEPAFRNRTGI